MKFEILKMKIEINQLNEDLNEKSSDLTIPNLKKENTHLRELVKKYQESKISKVGIITFYIDSLDW